MNIQMDTLSISAVYHSEQRRVAEQLMRICRVFMVLLSSLTGIAAHSADDQQQGGTWDDNHNYQQLPLVLADDILWMDTQPSVDNSPDTVRAPTVIETAETPNKPSLTPSIVQRAQLTHAIKDKEPVDHITTLSLSAQNHIYLFTEIKHKQGQSITHRWVFNDQVIAQVLLPIGSPQWRTYSSKAFNQQMIGQWQVYVMDENNQPLQMIEFDVTH